MTEKMRLGYTNNMVTVTYRSEIGDAAFTRVQGKTVSGWVHLRGVLNGEPTFFPTGKNRKLLYQL